MCLIFTSFYHSEIFSIVACGREDYKHPHKIVDCSGDLTVYIDPDEQSPCLWYNKTITEQSEDNQNNHQFNCYVHCN